MWWTKPWNLFVLQSQMPDPKTFKQHFESKHPKSPLPPELEGVEAWTAQRPEADCIKPHKSPDLKFCSAGHDQCSYLSFIHASSPSPQTWIPWIKDWWCLASRHCFRALALATIRSVHYLSLRSHAFFSHLTCII